MKAFTALPGLMSSASRFLTCSATVFLLFCSADAFALGETISFLPAHPTTGTEVQLTISGYRPDSCHREPLASITRTDNHFALTMSGEVVPSACTLSLIKYTITTSLGKLPAGKYSVTSTANVDWIENTNPRLPVEFVVAPPPSAARASITNILLDLLLDTPAVPAPSGPAATLAKRLGLPNRLLIGLGSGGSDTNLIKAQGLKPDFYERYLVGIGTQGGWTTWNSPPGAYAGYVMAQADSVGAVPMFTLFQFSADNLSDMTSLASSSYMQAYWADLITLFNQMNQFGKPAMLSVEPDFWGFAQAVTNGSYGGDPTKAPAVLSTDAACAGLPANLTGYAPCVLKLARKYAPKAAIGFPPSDWGGTSLASVIAFMNQNGTAQGDFIVMQTADRDAGCREQAALTPLTAQADCVSGQGNWYWDETNQTHPNFHDNFAMASAFHTGIGGLPIVWWQTPFGVPSGTAGGIAGHFRDNRVDYFLKHPSELVAVGGLGVVFGAGAENQTTPETDGGQYQTLSTKYLASPAALP